MVRTLYLLTRQNPITTIETLSVRATDAARRNDPDIRSVPKYGQPFAERYRSKDDLTSRTEEDDYGDRNEHEVAGRD